MKINIFRVVVFIVIIVASDYILGRVLKALYSTTNSRTIAKIRYSIDSTSQDILIYGSSRAQNHYIPDTISNYTGMSCYSCGIGGQGMAFSLIQISEMLKRHKPKLILLDISPNILLDPNSAEKLNILMPYYNKDTIIQHALTSVSGFEKFKYYSSIYPYNGSILLILKSLVYQRKDMNKGYIPIHGEIIPDYIDSNNSEQVMIPKQQLYYLDRIINICKTKEAELILVVSPIFKKNNADNKILLQIKSIAERNNIDYLDYSIDSSFRAKTKLFHDNLHLNTFGAAKYSIKISEKIRLMLNRRDAILTPGATSYIYLQ